jgi:ABC-type nickel/cobalt efflux system permease component RcnA
MGKCFSILVLLLGFFTLTSMCRLQQREQQKKKKRNTNEEHTKRKISHACRHMHIVYVSFATCTLAKQLQI